MGAAAIVLGLIFWVVVMVIGAGMYFLPTIIAVMQHRNNVAVIAVINTLLGWSFIGWIVALVMALTKDAQPVQVVHVQQQMGYMPTGYPQPQSPYGQSRRIQGAEVERINEQAGPGSDLRRVPPQEQRPP